MNESSVAASLLLRFQEVESRFAKRDATLTAIYSFLMFGAGALLVLFPFPLSRIGSVILMVGFGYMIWRCTKARQLPACVTAAPFQRELARLDEQIELARSLLFNVPFFVGANLFWMGLPGTGSALAKAVQDFVFLGLTVAAFAALYAFNQQVIRKELLPLRRELRRLAARTG